MSTNQQKTKTSGTQLCHTCMADALLSAEAKAVAAQTYYTGVAPEVSIAIDFKNGVSFSPEILREILIAGWGEQLAKHVEIVDVKNITDNEALHLVQSKVSSGVALFAVCNIQQTVSQRCYLSVHHALADEQTLKVVKHLIQLAHTGMLDLALQYMSQGRQIYCNYVECQRMTEKENCLLDELPKYSMTPVQLSETGGLAWSMLAKRINLHRTIRVAGVNDSKELLTIAVLRKLRDVGAISEGNVVCSSRCWRLSHESEAIGMMTGLVAIPLEQAKDVLVHMRPGLEARARHSLTARKALSCCRASELFVNGATPRGIPAAQVMNATFPVGIEIRRTGISEFRLEIEGAFCSKTAAADLLNELAEFFSNDRER